ncbi:hypothetical protein ABKN59_006499 [Abortiporus biennis]
MHLYTHIRTVPRSIFVQRSPSCRYIMHDRDNIEVIAITYRRRKHSRFLAFLSIPSSNIDLGYMYRTYW